MKIFEKSGFAKESFRAGCGEIIQYREYKNGKVSKDIDWSHIHKGIPRGTVHIHKWNGSERGDGRRLTPAEKKKYETILQQIDKDIKL